MLAVPICSSRLCVCSSNNGFKGQKVKQEATKSPNSVTTGYVGQPVTQNGQAYRLCVNRIRGDVRLLPVRHENTSVGRNTPVFREYLSDN